MPEILTLTTPEVHPSDETWEIVKIYLDKEAPAIKVTLKSNTGEQFTYRAIANETTTPGQILAGLNFINKGKFMTVDGLSLQRWLLKKINDDGVKVGTISGTPD